MTDYPKTLFRPGGPEIFYGRSYERCVVNDTSEEQQKLAQHWLLKPIEAPEPQVEAEPPKAEPKASADHRAQKATSTPKAAAPKKRVQKKSGK